MDGSPLTVHRPGKVSQSAMMVGGLILMLFLMALIVMVGTDMIGIAQVVIASVAPLLGG